MKTLDELMPQYEFSERHSIRVEAPPERAERALREVTLADVPLVRALFALRGLPRRGRVLDVVAGLGRVLEDAPGEGIVLGVRGQLWRVGGGDDGSAAAEAVADFRVGAAGLSTETRVHVADPAARRAFRRYWLVVRPFSGLVRMRLLRAAKRRAEAEVAR
jgi:hypothetical protein